MILCVESFLVIQQIKLKSNLCDGLWCGGWNRLGIEHMMDDVNNRDIGDKFEMKML